MVTREEQQEKSVADQEEPSIVWQAKPDGLKLP